MKVAEGPKVERVGLTVEAVRAASPVAIVCKNGAVLHYGKACLKKLADEIAQDEDGRGAE